MALRRANNFAPGTIYLPSETTPHFWVVLSDPARNADQVLVVNWTTDAPHKEQTCILEAGEHVCLTRRCCVYYIGARIVRLADLQYAELCNKIEVKGTLEEPILQRIREGADKSENILKAGPALLREQGLITSAPSELDGGETALE